jgi:hypothetical protein
MKRIPSVNRRRRLVALREFQTAQPDSVTVEAFGEKQNRAPLNRGPRPQARSPDANQNQYEASNAIFAPDSVTSEFLLLDDIL